MLKRVIRTFLVLVLCCTMVASVFAYPQDELMQGNRKNNIPQVYKVLPGTEEWVELGSLDARRSACYVSSEEADSMTTIALAHTVLDYPFLIDIFAFNTIQEGITSVCLHCPAITVFLHRDNAVEALTACSHYYDDKDEIKKLCADTLIRFLSKERISPSGGGLRTPPVVLTPKGSYVESDYDRTWSDAGITQTQANSLAYSYLLLYPSASIIAMPSPKYNCHSYAWYSQLTSNKIWIDDPSIYVADNSYTYATKAVGRKVSYDTTEMFIHSGIVVSAGSTDSTTVVRSKWGSNALFDHNADDCPYYNSISYFLLRYFKPTQT